MLLLIMFDPLVGEWENLQVTAWRRRPPPAEATLMYRVRTPRIALGWSRPEHGSSRIAGTGDRHLLGSWKQHFPDRGLMHVQVGIGGIAEIIVAHLGDAEHAQA
ncbi:MAG: hypothetical protein U0T03_06320 [Xanthomonadales bacterium]|nr:hypothetical protein [Pseudoxanthomonas sp.]MBP9535239.1 hypothetical protein [Pseudoxanthomonas sp.]MDZ3798397.1 hypothetical protein [Xanthomonadales bacterium]